MLHAHAQWDTITYTKTNTTQRKSGDNHVLHTTNGHSLSASAQLETATLTHTHTHTAAQANKQQCPTWCEKGVDYSRAVGAAAVSDGQWLVAGSAWRLCSGQRRNTESEIQHPLPVKITKFTSCNHNKRQNNCTERWNMLSPAHTGQHRTYTPATTPTNS